MTMQRRPDPPEGLWTPASLLAALAARGDAAAVLTMDGDAARPWPGGALAEDGLRFAAGLRNAGLAAEEPVGLYAPNSPRWVAARLGLGAAGALTVAVDDLAPETEAAAILRDAGCTRVLASRAHAEALRARNLAAGLHIVLLEEDAGAEGWRTLCAEAAGPRHDPAPDAPAMLVYTSGTTGAPKGFALTHANLNANLHGVLAQGQIGPADRMLVPLPLHHVYPFLVGLMTPIAAGSAVAFPEGVTGPALVAALKGTRATVMVGVPRLYTALLAGLEGRVAARGPAARAAFAAMLRTSLAARRREMFIGRRLFAGLHAQLAPELKLMVSGGARLEEEASWKLEALGWRLLNGYGLAETASLFTGNVPGRQRIGSEGQPIATGSEIRIAAPDTTAPLPVGAEGEIQLRGANVFAGYLNNDAANEAAFTADGWFRSGDLGHLDAEGFVFVTGRLKEMIVLGGGKNVFPEPVERHYTRGPVREIAVLDRAGALVAVVVPDTAAIRAPNAKTVEDALRVALAEAANELPSFQRLAGFVVSREPLPRTRLGKVQRFRLPALYDALRAGAAPRAAAEHAPEDLVLLAAPGAKEAWAILRARDPAAPEPSLDAHPGLDLGMDSLAWVGVALELESRLGVRLSEEEIAGFATLRDLLRHVAGAVGTPVAAAAAEDSSRWTAPPPAALQPLRIAAWGGVVGLGKAMFRLRADGTEHLPRSGPFVVVANHVSDLDPGLVAAALPLAVARRVWFGGTTDRLFATPTSRALLRAFQVFPVDERAPARTVAMAREVLARGDGLVWFPESWRSPDGALQRFLPGIGLILDGAGPVPVIPCLIEGAFEAMPRNRRLPRPHPVRVSFGAPLLSDNLAGPGPDRPARIAATLREAVAALKAGSGE